MIRNERGVALVMVMVIAFIGLAMVSTLLFMVTQSTRVSGSSRIFRTTDEAGLGGSQIATQFVSDNVYNASSGANLAAIPNLSMHLPATLADPCLKDKLTLTRGAWDTSDPKYYWPNCTGDRALKIDADLTPDFTFNVPANYKVYAKIVDTVKGNTAENGLGGNLGGTGVVNTQEGEITPPPNPTLYRIEVQAQDATSPLQRSKYSVLYAY